MRSDHIISLLQDYFFINELLKNLQKNYVCWGWGPNLLRELIKGLQSSPDATPKARHTKIGSLVCIYNIAATLAAMASDSGRVPLEL